jgi:hypothetical protein
MKNQFWWAFLGSVILIGTILIPQAMQKSSTSLEKDSLETTAFVAEKQAESEKITAKSTAKKYTVHPEYNSLATLLAGLPLEDSLEKSLGNLSSIRTHQSEFNKGWQNLETKRLSKIRAWRNKELTALNEASHNLFYPFSGPDFLNAHEIFPNCQNYLLFGLEPIGELPSLAQLKGQTMAVYLQDVRQGLSEIFNRNYFITSRMGQAFRSSVKGVLPTLSIFLARTQHQILNIERVYLNKKGEVILEEFTAKPSQNLLTAVRITFLHPQKNEPQYLYYFSTDLSNTPMAGKPELKDFVVKFSNKITLIKSASYLLHTAPFTNIRELILNHTEACVQDDTGVPYQFFKKAGWEVTLYGKYARPIRDFNYGYQPDLAQVFAQNEASIQPIDFTFGYHWWTDKSSILYCKKGK